MSWLKKVSTGIVNRPPFIVIYGIPKVGKTTFASKAPNPYVIDVEAGSNLIATNRVYPKTYADVVEALKELSTAEHSFKTVVIDSLDHLEPLVWKSVCTRFHKDSIEDVGGGYQKGYIEALKEWNEIISLLKDCRDKKGMMIICVAHVHTKPVKDPTQIAAYDQYEMKFHHKASAIFKENADAIFFAKKETLIVGGDEHKKGKAVGDGKHVLLTQGMPGYEAGNRYNLPNEMDLDFEKVYALMRANLEADPEALKKQITGIVSLLKEDIRKKALEALEKAGSDIAELQKLYKRAIELGGKQK